MVVNAEESDGTACLIPAFSGHRGWPSHPPPFKKFQKKFYKTGEFFLLSHQISVHTLACITGAEASLLESGLQNRGN